MGLPRSDIIYLMKEGFNVDKAKDIGLRNDFDKLNLLISTLEEKWGDDKMGSFLTEHLKEKEELKKAWELHKSFGDLPK